MSLHINERKEQSVNFVKSIFVVGFLISLLVSDAYLKGVVELVRDLFGLDEHFKQAVREFAMGYKTNDGFAVLQGQNWLNIR